MASSANLHLFAWGATHKTTPEDLRASLSIEPDRMLDAYAYFRELNGVEECMLLNTCNRVELYGVCRDSEGPRDFASYLPSFRGLDPRALEQKAFSLQNDAAIQHIFEVSAGLDSMMVGENEILGQVKDSYAQAQKTSAVGPVLNRIVQKSFQHAKWARTHTGIAKGQTSIGMVAVELASRIYGKLNKSRVLVLGSGEVAEKTIEALHGRGVKHITVSSRTYENARALADRFAGAALDFKHFSKHLADFDIIVASTSAPDLVLHREDIEKAQNERPYIPHFLIDLAMPRDIDPSVQDMDNVFLYDLKDLAEIANQNLQSRMAEVDRVRTTFAERAAVLWEQICGRFA
ncbi:MAG: glutamyl-tRNA reductase [Opitutales bacterium]